MDSDSKLVWISLVIILLLGGFWFWKMRSPMVSALPGETRAMDDRPRPSLTPPDASSDASSDSVPDSK